MRGTQLSQLRLAEVNTKLFTLAIILVSLTVPGECM